MRDEPRMGPSIADAMKGDELRDESQDIRNDEEIEDTFNVHGIRGRSRLGCAWQAVQAVVL